MTDAEKLLDTFEQAANQFGLTSVEFSRGHIDRATYDRDCLAERDARAAIAAEIIHLRARPGWRDGVEAAAASLDESADTLEKEAPGSVTASTMARIYREKAAVIRALKEPADG